uniref:Exonuclease RNase T and DNA polymerase III (Orn, REX2, REXO2) n=1 Tax=uncultured marine group II/III euryarchaeote AD1000_01_G07 TaxID=1457698 RepID=A0A075FKK8_9EURY|nr:Exonuclease RNase T and DNA polymerase III (orn, REX2, REXO2) [uncultured marine group II/III euryarchaeote AD1000_01_G07]
MVEERLVWMDLEMTGLDADENTIIEIATIVTEGDLTVVAEGPAIAISQPESELAKMDDWNLTHHTKNGLLDRVRNQGTPMAEAEAQTIEFLREHCIEGVSPLCGNTIGQDRRFLRRYMPDLHGFFHYRSVDVTSIKQLVDRWYPNMPRATKPAGHRALDDIRGSIAELQYYRENVFRELP